ncbi:MAG: phage terminase large subunit, partial [Niameybacter sp.]
HEHDLCGYLMEKEPDEWRVLSLPAIQVDDDGKESALWELKHTLPELRKMRILDPLVFDTQYLQDPTPKEGLLYSRGFKTYSYEQLPKTGHGVKRCNYTDTADTGADNLCSICFIDTPEYIYITDVLFTDKPMEATEPATAEMLNANKVQVSRIESNNGGRGFCRNVQRIIRTTFKNPRIVFVPFTQTANKYVRMFTRSAEVQNLVLMPEEWEHLWPKFHSALMSYRKDNKRRSQHDDAPDALTGVVEMHGQNTSKTKVRQRN